MHPEEADFLYVRGGGGANMRNVHARSSKMGLDTFNLRFTRIRS